MKQARCGVVLRDTNGRLIYGFAKSFGHYFIFIVEYWATLCGLQAVRKSGYKKVNLKCDSKTLINYLFKGGHYESYLIQVIMELLNKGWEVEVLHTFR